MAEIKMSLIRPLLVSSVLIVQGCATTDELFAEYDQNFCHATDDYSMFLPQSDVDYGYQRVAEPVVEPVVEPVIEKVAINWNPAVFFRAGSSVLSQEGTDLIKANAKQLLDMPGYKIALKSLSEDEITDEFNRTLYSKRLDSIKHLLVNVLKIDADRIVESLPKELSQEDAANLDMVDVELVDKDRRVGLILLDDSLEPVAVNVKAINKEPVAESILTERPWSKARPPTQQVKKPVLAAAAPKPDVPALAPQAVAPKMVVAPKPVQSAPVAPKVALPTAAVKPAMPQIPAPIAPIAPVQSVAAIPAQPVAPTAPAPTVAVTPVTAASGMRTIVYEKWTITEPASSTPTMPVLASALPQAPTVTASVANTILAEEDGPTTETYTLEQAALADGITYDLNSALDKVYRLKEIHPTHDYSVNGEMYIARILVMLGRHAVKAGNAELAKRHLSKALAIDPNVRRQAELRAAIANSQQAKTASSKPVTSKAAVTKRTAYILNKTAERSEIVGPQKPVSAAALPSDKD